MADGNKVIYEVRADDSNLEKDLNRAEQNIRKKAQGGVDAVKKSAQEASNEVSKAASESAQRLGKPERAAKDVDKAMSSIDAGGLDDVKSAANDAESSLNDVAGAAGDLASSLIDMGTDGAGAFSGLIANAGGLKDALSGLGGKGIALGIGAGAVAASVAGVSAANDLNKALNSLQAQTGLTESEMADYEDVLRDIYTNNYGESFDDIANAMSTVRQQMGDLSDADLQTITESAFALRDTFGYDIQESVRAANAMVTQFGIDGDTAMSMIAAGAQNGLDFSGELLDSISEYSVQFAKMGLSADDMFKIFQKGAETGAFNLDKIGDAVKENAIRVIDYSDTTKDAYAQLGLDVDEMSAKFAAGGDIAREAFDQVMTGLIAIKDPVKQNQIGGKLFGEMWNDLGPTVVGALGDIEDGAYDAAGAMDQIKEVKYDDITNQLESMGRKLQDDVLVPVGQMLIPVLQTFMEVLTPILDLLVGILTPILETTGELIGDLMEPLEEMMDFIAELMEPLGELIESLLTPLMGVLQSLLEPLMSIVSAILPALMGLFEGIMPVLATVVEAIRPIIDILGSLISTIMDVLTPVINGLAALLTGTLKGAFDIIAGVIDSVKGVFEGIITFIKNVFTGNWEAAWNGVVSAFKGVINLIPGFFEIVINAIISVINGITSGLSSIWTWTGLPSIPAIPNVTLPRLKVGMDYVPADDFPALLHIGERVMTREENQAFTALGGLQGMETALSGQMGAKGGPSETVIQVPLYLNGRQIAKATAVYMGEQQSWEAM